MHHLLLETRVRDPVATRRKTEKAKRNGGENKHAVKKTKRKDGHDGIDNSSDEDDMIVYFSRGLPGLLIDDFLEQNEVYMRTDRYVKIDGLSPIFVYPFM
jgi:hypothetical protein